MEGAPEVIFSKVNIKKLKEDLSPDGGQILNTEMRVSATFKLLTFSFPEGKPLYIVFVCWLYSFVVTRN